MCDFRWKLFPNNSVAALGINFNSTIPANQNPLNWNNKLCSVHKILSLWTQLDLSVTGRVMVAKSLICSQFTYQMSSIGLPNEVLLELNKITFKFIWKGKDKVKRNVIIADYDSGDLKLIDMVHLQHSVSILWLKKSG